MEVVVQGSDVQTTQEPNPRPPKRTYVRICCKRENGSSPPTPQPTADFDPPPYSSRRREEGTAGISCMETILFLRSTIGGAWGSFKAETTGGYNNVQKSDHA